MDWQERMNEFTEHDFQVEIYFRRPDKVSLHEAARLRLKLEHMKPTIRRLCLGMLKGTLKYDTDTRDTAEWQAFMDDEITDLFNYLILRGTNQ